MVDLKRKLFRVLAKGGAQPEPAAARPAEPSAAGASVSALLKATRKSQGMELRDVATTLKIRHVYMLAIEDGRFSELPGPAYAVGFLRTYSDFLGLDGDIVVRRYKDEIAGKVGRQYLYMPTPVPEGRVPGGTVLLIAVVFAGVAYGGWYYLSAIDRSVVDLIPALPQRLVSLLEVLPFGSTSTPGEPAAPSPAAKPPAASPRPAAGATAPAAAPPAPPPGVAPAGPASPPAVASPTGSAAAPAGTAAASPASVTRGENRLRLGVATPPAPTQVPTPAPTAAPTAMAPAGPALGGPALGGGDHGSESADEVPLVSGPADEAGASRPAAETAAAAPAIPVPPPLPEAKAVTRMFGTQNRESRIQLLATQDSWVQLRDGNGDLLFTRVLRPGDAYRVPDRPGVRLRTGNAGGLTVTVDGVGVAPLGAVGQVVRDIALDPARLQRAGN
ncbi:MAG: DUF4115 domain-containing protein [Azospirillum sp.]|nr:DUF4115 domain-containing protein [Azospirillum sp.]